MNESEKKVLQEVFYQLCGVTEINESDSLSEDLGLDSLALVTLMILLEDAFHIVFLAADLDPFALKTVDDIEKLLSKYLTGGAP